METCDSDDRGPDSGDTIEVIGHRIGHLVVKSIIYDSQGIARRILCRCDCGKLVRISLTRLRRNQHKDACVKCWRPPPGRRGRPKKDICERTYPREYMAWKKIRKKARGKWKWNFEKFFKDMGPKPRGFMLHRHDDTEPYCPSNCYWGELGEKKMTRPLTYKGEFKTVAWVVRTFGIRHGFVKRCRRLGMLVVEDILTAWEKSRQSQETMETDDTDGGQRSAEGSDQIVPGGAEEPQSLQ